jgi:hypothetical protein
MVFVHGTYNIAQRVKLKDERLIMPSRTESAEGVMLATHNRS